MWAPLSDLFPYDEDFTNNFKKLLKFCLWKEMAINKFWAPNNIKILILRNDDEFEVTDEDVTYQFYLNELQNKRTEIFINQETGQCKICSKGKVAVSQIVFPLKFEPSGKSLGT